MVTTDKFFHDTQKLSRDFCNHRLDFKKLLPHDLFPALELAWWQKKTWYFVSLRSQIFMIFWCPRDMCFGNLLLVNAFLEFDEFFFESNCSSGLALVQKPYWYKENEAVSFTTNTCPIETVPATDFIFIGVRFRR